MHDPDMITISPPESLDARQELFQLLAKYPASDEEKEQSLGLFVRGSLLARMMAIGELYQQIVELPGMVLDVGARRGQTAVLCENFRSIYEPLHLNRRIAVFDSFEGAVGLPPDVKPAEGEPDGSDYASLLLRILKLHERSNAMGHVNGKHQVLEGDWHESLDWFLRGNPNEVVALAFIDAIGYDSAHQCFQMIYERLVPDGIIAFWQLTQNRSPAEGAVYAEQILGKFGHKLRRSRYYPGLCYLIKK